MQKRFKINYVDLVPLIPVQVKYPITLSYLKNWACVIEYMICKKMIM